MIGGSRFPWDFSGLGKNLAESQGGTGAKRAAIFLGETIVTDRALVCGFAWEWMSLVDVYCKYSVVYSNRSQLLVGFSFF